MNILSIDVGIINLGYVFANILDNEITVIECNRIDITNMRHRSVSFCDCKLHHEFCIPDYLDHFIQEHRDIFDTADIILIERQPPMGITNVQDLLFVKFRSKIKLISPGSVHKFFNMSSDYSFRKKESQHISDHYLNDNINYNNNDRKHDITDAMLMILYYFKKMYKKKGITDFEEFRLISQIN